ncbi:MAG: FtsX-like permease family protein, partial [Gemmatimonadales bacterium]
IGLAAVLVRNVLERRRELALLRAVGYRQGHLALLVLAENLLLLVVGLATGAISALVAIAPAVWSRGGEVPVAVLGVMLSAVLLVGAVVSVLAVQALHRAPLLAALRAE